MRGFPAQEAPRIGVSYKDRDCSIFHPYFAYEPSDDIERVRLPKGP